MPKPATRSCANCRFSDTDAFHRWLRCHRHAPPAYGREILDDKHRVAAFPLVEPHQWCGEHQPAQNGAAA